MSTVTFVEYIENTIKSQRIKNGLELKDNM